MELLRTELNQEWRSRFDEVKKFELYSKKEGKVLENAVINNFNIKGLKLLEFQFQNTKWQNVKAQQQEWLYVLIEDSEFENVDFSNSNFGSMTFKNVTFKNVTFKSSQMRDVIFEDCVFDKIDFSHIKNSQLVFKNSTLNHPTFEDGHASLQFKNDKINKIQFSGLKSSSLEFIGGDLTTDRHMYKLNIEKLILNGTHLKNKSLPIDGQFGKIILKNLSSEWGGGVPLLILQFHLSLPPIAIFIF